MILIKQVFEDENFKRVDLSIFIPKADSKVIIRNYANEIQRHKPSKIWLHLVFKVWAKKLKQILLNMIYSI